MQQKYLWIKEDSYLRKVEMESILFACTRDRGCEIFLVQTTFKLNCSLVRLMEKMPAGLFIQISKSVVINPQQASVVSREVIVVRGIRLPIAHSYASELLKKLNFLS